MDSRLKKLQIQLARLQAERDAAMQKAAAQPSPLGWLSYALAGVIVLLLAVIGFLMRRERTHPATEYAMPAPGHAPEDTDTGEHAAYAPADEPEPEPEFEAVVEEESLHAGMHAPEEEESTGIPDLTEEDTGRMEAFRETAGDQPDPNVDYLAESDVYLRYGMEDEAVQQVRMALQLDAGNADAHIKMAQLLRAKGDQTALDEAAATARRALQGEALARFEQALAGLDQGAVEVFGDTLPPTTEPGNPAEIDLGDLDVAWSDLEMPAAEPAVEPEAEAEDDALDLSDIEFPETEDAESGPLAQADDLDKTVAIGPREVAEAIGIEPEFDMEAEAGAETGAAETEPEAPAPATIDADMDLGDFDFDQADLDQAVASASEDEFTSTIRTTLPKEEGDDAAGQEAAAEDKAPALDLSAELEVDSEKGDALKLADVEAAHDELDSLLDELADESEKDGGGKKS
jgi:hypothetical protein